MRNDDTEFYQESRRDRLITLAISGATLALLAIAGYLTPYLLALAAR